MGDGIGFEGLRDAQAVLGEIRERLTQATQSVAAVGRPVTALAEGLRGAEAKAAVQAATARLIGLALPTPIQRATKGIHPAENRMPHLTQEL